MSEANMRAKPASELLALVKAHTNDVKVLNMHKKLIAKVAKITGQSKGSLQKLSINKLDDIVKKLGRPRGRPRRKSRSQSPKKAGTMPARVAVPRGNSPRRAGTMSGRGTVPNLR